MNVSYGEQPEPGATTPLWRRLYVWVVLLLKNLSPSYRRQQRELRLMAESIAAETRQRREEQRRREGSKNVREVSFD